MSSKLIFLLLTALLLVQCSIGKPMPDADTVAEVSKDEESKKESKAGESSDATSKEKSEAEAFGSFVVAKLTEIGDLILTNEKKIVEDVLGDINAMEEKSEALTIRINKLSAYANKLDKIDFKDEHTLIHSLRLLKEMIVFKKIATTELEEANAQDLIIESSLKKHGLEKMVEDVKVKILEFCERYSVAVDKYWDSLSSQEQIENKAFAEEVQRFKNETALDKKLIYFFEGNEPYVEKPIEEDVKAKIIEFTEWFYIAAEEYWDSLSPEEQTEKKALAEWLKLYKEEDNFENKVTLFGKIFG